MIAKASLNRIVRPSSTSRRSISCSFAWSCWSDRHCDTAPISAVLFITRPRMKGYTPRLFAMMPLMMALTLSATFVATQRASLNFYSSSSVWPGVFSQLAAASFDGVMTYDYALPPGVPVGYVQSSPHPQPWWGTMWTRDAGAFLRECVLWGDVDAAAATAQLLMQLAPKNPAGFISFPGRFDLLQPGDTSLSEVDASASIFISSVLLWQRLPASHPLRTRLLDFLLGNSSVVRGFKAQLSQRPLVHGSGEFGGGAFTPGEWVNVAQNAFVAAAFDAAASISHGFEGHGYDDDWAADANTLRAAMLDIMTNSTTGGWCSASVRALRSTHLTRCTPGTGRSIQRPCSQTQLSQILKST